MIRMVELTKKEISDAAGYSYHRLHDIERDLPKEKKFFLKTDSGKYDLAVFVQRWVAYNVEKASSSDMSLEDAKAVHEKVKIEKPSLRLTECGVRW